MHHRKIKTLSKVLGQLKRFYRHGSSSAAVSLVSTQSKKTPLTILRRDILQLKQLRYAVHKKRTREALKNIPRNKQFFETSTFELMEYDFHENTHSNVLEYLFDYRRNGDIGTLVLEGLIHQIGGNAAYNYLRSIKKHRYKVEREKYTGNGRIDLIIHDSVDRFVILIENKIFAKVGSRYDEQDSNTPSNQLVLYRNFVESHYKEYQKLYIILSYQDQDTDYPHYIKMDYRQLYKVCKSIISSNAVLSQYLLLLHSLITEFDYKKDILKNVDALNKNERLSLNELQLIIGVGNE